LFEKEKLNNLILGICLYEFLCGMVPFGEDAEDPYEIYENAIKSPIKYPNYVDDKRAKKLIEQLLNKIPEIRLGASYAQLKSHLFFSDLDWVINIK
jgi:cGMP-dependent protein kinase